MRPEKRLERRANIIRAARKVFHRYGYRKTALEDVARAASVGKATLYHYFDGKDDLFGAVVTQMFHEYLARQKEGIIEDEAATDNLRRFACQLIEEHRNLSGTVRGIAQEDEELPDRIRAHLRRQRRGELEILEEILRSGISVGEFRPMNTGRVALLLLGSLRAMIMDAMSRTESADEVVSEFLEILLCGLLANTDEKELS